MSTLSETAIKSGDLLNRLVLDYKTTEKVGRVKQLWLDVKTHQVTGLTCASGMLGREQHSFSWDKIETIGKDSILVNLEEQEEVEQPELIDRVIGLGVWTDGGNKAGKLIEYCLDPQTGAVVDYLFVSNGWRGITHGTYRLPPSGVISIGSKRIIFAEAMVENPVQYEEGLGGKIRHAQESIKEDYVHSQEDFAVAVKNTQKFASQLQEKAQQATEKAKEKLSEFKAKASEDRQTAVETDSENDLSTIESDSEFNNQKTV